jgi:hypothetical protein
MVNEFHYSERERGIRDEFAMHRDGATRIDKDPRVRDPRVSRGERTHLDLDTNSRHLVNNNSNYDDGVDLIRERDRRRDRDADYSPQHRGNRRVLNANAM